MGGLSIEAQQRIEELREALRKGVRRLASSDDVAMREESAGEATRVDLELRVSDQVQETSFREEVAHVLAQHIVTSLSPDLMRRLLRRNYGYFDSEEREQILEYACSEAPQPGLVRSLAHRLREYLEQSQALNLEGFLTFRMKDYVADLERSLDAAVDEFMLDREYREFVRLLRYFVDVQAPKIPVAHVILRENGLFELRGEEMEPLRGEFTADFHFESEEGEINLDDLLVSSLITAAPAEIVIHGPQAALELPSVRTVRQVFGERMQTCTGCSACEAVNKSSL